MQIIADMDHPIDMANIGMDAWFDGDKFNASSKKVTFINDDVTITFSGSHLDVDKDGSLVGGKVSSVLINYGRRYEDTTFRMMNVDAEDLSRVILSKSKSDDRAFFNSLFSGDDKILASEGNDNLFGGKGNDFIRADSGDDTIDGGLGNDRIQSGAGTDTIMGGKGADVFEFYGWWDSSASKGVDTILDFSPVDGDKIDLNTSGFKSFDDLVITRSDTLTSVEYNDGTEKVSINLKGDIALTADDFIF